VDDSQRFDQWIAQSSARIFLYASMLAGTLGGQAIGIAADVALGLRALWIPAIFSVVLEALAGARAGAVRAGRALTANECLRVSTNYSIGFAAVTLPLAGWTFVSLRFGDGGARAVASGPGARWIVADIGFFLAVMVAATFARAALMRAFSRRRK
jgi:hypothetical protein